MKARIFNSLALAIAFSLSSGCVEHELKTPEEEKAEKAQKAKLNEPQPQVVKVKVEDGLKIANRPNTKNKNLFNINLSPNSITANNTKLKSKRELESLLSKYQGAIFTLNTHRCVESAYAAEILNLIQSFTTTPIAFGSYGEYTDEECQ